MEVEAMMGYNEPDSAPMITLGQFLKLVGAVGTGGEGKLLIAEGQVAVNDSVETRRGRKLYSGDLVTVANNRGQKQYEVAKYLK